MPLADRICSSIFRPMNWLILIIAGLFEVGFTSCMAKWKETSGPTSALWFTGFIISISLSMYLLFKATETLPLGTAYAVWTGIGAAGTVIIGIVFFDEPAAFWRLFFIFTLIASIIGLKWVSN
jgi:quaternary ammonium compound-resistance protein SugE